LSAPDFDPALTFPDKYQAIARALFRSSGNPVPSFIERQLDAAGKKTLNEILRNVTDNTSRVTSQHCKEVALEVREAYKASRILSGLDTASSMLKAGNSAQDVETFLNRLITPLKAIGTIHSSTDIKDIAEEVEAEDIAIVRGEKTKSVPTGFSKLDKELLLMRAEVLGIFGIAKSGKTSLAVAIAANVAERLFNEKANSCVVYFSMEMTQKELCRRMAASRARFDLRSLNADLDENDPSFLRYQQEMKVVKQWPIKIDPRAGLSGSQMAIELDKYTAEEGGVTLAVLDYATMAESDKKTGSDTTAIQAIFREFKAMVKNHVNTDGSNPAGIMVGELNRENEDAFPTRKRLKYAGDYELAAAITPVDPVEFKDDKHVMAFLANRALHGLPQAPYQQERWIHIIFNRYAGVGTIDQLRFTEYHTRWEQGQW
jgi:replicative DNA helicase